MRRAQQGFTLVEVLVAALITAVVAGAILTFLVVSLRQQNQVSARARSVARAQAGLAQLIADLGQAIGSDPVSIAQSGSTVSISLTIPVPGDSAAGEQVLWTCPYSSDPSPATAGACTRQVGGEDAPSVTEMTGIESMTLAPQGASGQQLSLPASDPAYVGITLYVEDRTPGSPAAGAPEAGSAPIVIANGVDLRNFQ